MYKNENYMLQISDEVYLKQPRVHRAVTASQKQSITPEPIIVLMESTQLSLTKVQKSLCCLTPGFS